MITKEALDIANALVSGVRKVLGLAESECRIVARGLETYVGWSPLDNGDPAAEYLAVDMQNNRAFGFVLEVFARRVLPVTVVMERRSLGWAVEVVHGPEPRVVRSVRDVSAVCDAIAKEIRDRLAGDV